MCKTSQLCDCDRKATYYCATQDRSSNKLVPLVHTCCSHHQVDGEVIDRDHQRYKDICFPANLVDLCPRRLLLRNLCIHNLLSLSQGGGCRRRRHCSIGTGSLPLRFRRIIRGSLGSRFLYSVPCAKAPTTMDCHVARIGQQSEAGQPLYSQLHSFVVTCYRIRSATARNCQTHDSTNGDYVDAEDLHLACSSRRPRNKGSNDYDVISAVRQLQHGSCKRQD
mmetsp:Transcript_49951/g.118931  ORF Transcript_49951/g.118931 Transcript_49951/m.118931 type:complete len:222 (-) Transcript_49951:245-910(-)